MPWYVPWSENIKKRACRYLLQRYLGQFLEEKLTLDQLSVDLYNGTGTVSNLSLDCEALNELGEAQGWPLEFVDGFVQQVDVSIPWATLLKDDSFVQISGLAITVQPKQRAQPAASMLESMWSSMTSSMQLAAECLQQGEAEGEGPAPPQPVEGIELFAQTIDSILCRVKVRFSDTKIRMEHVPKDSHTGVALEIHIKNIDYLDEAGSDPPTELLDSDKNKTYIVSTFTTKKIAFEGVTFHTDEFPSKARTISRSILIESSQQVSTETVKNKEEHGDNVQRNLGEGGLYESYNTMYTSAEDKSTWDSRHGGMFTSAEENSKWGSPPGGMFSSMDDQSKWSSKPAGVFICPEEKSKWGSPTSEDKSTWGAHTPEDKSKWDSQSTGKWGSPGGMFTSSDDKANWGSAGQFTNLEDKSRSEIEAGLSNLSLASEPIVFGRLAGRQEMRIRIKQSSEAAGPKVDFQLTLGSMTVFLSPRQFHILMELAEGLASPHLEDNSNVPSRHPGLECKPMRPMDYERVEAQLMGGLATAGGARGLGHHHGWSTTNMEDSDNEEEEHFLPLRRREDSVSGAGAGGQGWDSMASSFSSSVGSNASSLGSMATNTTTNRTRKRGSHTVEGDPSAEVSQVHIRIASVACILLHEDILTLSASMNGECLAASSVKQMKLVSEEFFTKMGLFAISYGSKDLEEASKAFDDAVTCNHLRLIAAPLVLEATEKTSNSGSCLSGHLTMARVQLTECLRTMKASSPLLVTVPLLVFSSPDSKPAQSSDGYDSSYVHPMSKTPNMKIHFKNTQRAVRVSGERKYVQPKTEITVNVEGCTVEVDVSMVDRLCAVLSPQPLCTRTRGCPAEEPLASQPPSQENGQCTIKIVSPDVCIRLRFPVADLRPPHDMARTAWWQRSVRPDLLLARLQTASLSLQTGGMTLRCRQLRLCYSESEGDNEIHLGTASADETLSSADPNSLPGPDWPTLTINSLPVEQLQGTMMDSWMEADVRPQKGPGLMGQSSAMLEERLGARPGPFSSKKMVHESDTPHGKEDEDDTEELVIPGDAAEMAEFIDYSIKNSLMQIQCNLPIVSLQLGSKHLYEVLYNRVNSDLLLWEGSAPRPTPRPPGAPGLQGSRGGTFAMCKSAINYNSDSESSSSSSESNNIYYSVYDQKARHERKTKSAAKALDMKERVGKINNTCFHLQIGKGLVTLYTPVRDSQNLVLPVQQGEVALTVGGVSLCHVAGVGGNPKRALMSLQAGHALLQHCGLIPMPQERAPLRQYGSLLPGHLKPCVGPSGTGARVRDSPACPQRDLLSVALSIQPSKDYPNFKTIRVTAGISNCTLRHVMTAPRHSVLSQVMDMFDVLDYPVPGYEPSTVITEMHVHLWDCAVDYRPLHLPLRTVVTLGSFSVSSNVVAQSNASNLRFIAEECALFIAEGSSEAPVDLKKEYVEVIDLGLFELSLRLNDMDITTAPRMDLRASNNVVHVRTCSDSFTALCRLIDYLAGDGDLTPLQDPQGQGEPDRDNSLEEDLIGVLDRPEEIRDLSKSQVQEVNDMMAEAMKESVSSNASNQEKNPSADHEGVEIFFFPDESKAVKPVSTASSSTDLTGGNFADCEPTSGEYLSDEAVNSLRFGGAEEEGGPIALVARELGDYSVEEEKRKSEASAAKKSQGRKSSGENTDDEFCILGDDIMPGAGMEPEVRWLTKEPPYIIDNHFSVPIGKTDLLKPPKNFPMAVLRYTLREMTVVWHMYGGYDLSPPKDKNGKEGPRGGSLGPTKKTVTISDDTPHSPTFAHRGERDPYNVLPQSPLRGGLWGSVSYNKSSESVSHGTGAPAPSGGGGPWPLRGGKGRRHDVLMELQLNKVQFLHETYPAGSSAASRQVLVVSSVEIRDRLASSQVNKFLYQYTSEQRPKRKHANMVVVKAVHLRPEGRAAAPECCLKVSLLPLRFNIDQDALIFLVSFFTQLTEADFPKDSSLSSAQSGSSQSLHSIGGGSPRHPPAPPVMGLGPREPDLMVSSDCQSEDSISIRDDDENSTNPMLRSYEAERLVSENLILLEEDWKGGAGRGSSVSSRGRRSSSITPRGTPEPSDDSPIYFRNVVFSPEVPIRLDYQGKRVDLTHGPLAGLLMGLAQLNCSELRLKGLYYRHGLLGLDRLIRWALQEWLADIKRHQLPGLLGGVGPMYALLQLFHGIKDLFWLPIEQYQKDGRLVRGLQRGASSFTTSTAMAALDITARIIHLIQATAETAYDMVSPHPGLRAVRRRRRDRPRQPQDIREGVTNAYHIVKDGINETAQAIAEVAVSERAARGYSGAVGGVLRQLPPTALAPILLASTAMAKVLGGVRASLQPQGGEDQQDKWRQGKQ